MVGKFILAAAAAALLAHAPAAEAPADGATLPVRWEILPTGEADGRVQLSLRHRAAGSSSHNSNAYDLSALEGLDPAQLASDRSVPVHFRIAREAGTLDCRGDARRGRGEGACLFRAAPGFADALERRGIDRPSLSQQYQLALQDVGTPLVEELARQGYETPGLDDLVNLGIHGATVDYLRALDATGLRVGEADALVQMRIHGVTPQFVAAMRSLGYGDFGADELVGMRIHGVDPELVRTLASLGYPRLSGDEITQMAIHGVSPEYIRELAEIGYRDLRPDQLVQLRIHGVTAEDARSLNAAIR